MISDNHRENIHECSPIMLGWAHPLRSIGIDCCLKSVKYLFVLMQTNGMLIRKQVALFL